MTRENAKRVWTWRANWENVRPLGALDAFGETTRVLDVVAGERDAPGAVGSRTHAPNVATSRTRPRTKRAGRHIASPPALITSSPSHTPAKGAPAATYSHLSGSFSPLAAASSGVSGSNETGSALASAPPMP